MKKTLFTSVQCAPEFTESDLLSMIGQNEYERRKRVQPGGIFRAFVIAHTGESHPLILDSRKSHPVEWTRKALESLMERIKSGLKIFYAHNRDNSHTNRDQVGEVITSQMREIEGRDAVVVAAHFPAARKSLAEKINSISMEAVWEISENAGRWIAERVNKLTGLALVPPDSAPAFEGAHVLATVAATTASETEIEKEEKVKKMEEGTEIRKKIFEERELDFGELIWAIRNGVKNKKIFPSQIFQPDEFLGRIESRDGRITFNGGRIDREYQEHIEKNIIAPVLNMQEELKKNLADEQKKNADLERQMKRYTFAPKIDDVAKELKIAPHVLNLAKANIDKFDPGENPEENLRKFFESQIAESQRLEKLGFIPAGAGANTRENSPVPSLGSGAPGEQRKNPWLPDKE